MKDAIAAALKPYGYEWLVSATGIAGPGSMIVVFAGVGDFYTACLTHDDQVVWVMTCGGQEVDANTDDCNALHQRTRDLYRISNSGSATQSCVSRFAADLNPGEDCASVSATTPGDSLEVNP